MRALIRTGPNKETLSLDTSHPEPSPTSYPNSYIIQTKATALTRGELAWPEPLIPEVPVPGFDFAGIIQSAPLTPGPKVFKVGDEVYGLGFPFSEKGSARDLTTMDERELSIKPKGLSWEQAAAVPLSALTAWQALFTHGKLNPPGQGGNAGKRVLVTAASGGVGIWLIQLARLAGVEVTGTCGPSNVDFVSSLGANVVLDYTKTDFAKWATSESNQHQFDLVVDCIGGQTLPEAWKCAKQGVIVVSVAEPPEGKRPAEGVAADVKGVWFIVEANREQLIRITEMIEQGKCRGEIDRVYALEEWKEAFERLEGGHARGKVVLKL